MEKQIENMDENVSVDKHEIGYPLEPQRPRHHLASVADPKRVQKQALALLKQFSETIKAGEEISWDSVEKLKELSIIQADALAVRDEEKAAKEPKGAESNA